MNARDLFSNQWIIPFYSGLHEMCVRLWESFVIRCFLVRNLIFQLAAISSIAVFVFVFAIRRWFMFLFYFLF